MPVPAHTPQATRRAAILELLARGPVHSQAELAERLESAGQVANQATLSRDLRALGVVKGARGYALAPAGAPPPEDGAARLLQALGQYFRGALAAQNQVLIRTPPGGAQPLAAALDDAPPEGVLGTLGGEDTVLVITPDGRRARSLARWLEARA